MFFISLASSFRGLSSPGRDCLVAVELADERAACAMVSEEELLETAARIRIENESLKETLTKIVDGNFLSSNPLPSRPSRCPSNSSTISSEVTEPSCVAAKDASSSETEQVVVPVKRKAGRPPKRLDANGKRIKLEPDATAVSRLRVRPSLPTAPTKPQPPSNVQRAKPSPEKPARRKPGPKPKVPRNDDRSLPSTPSQRSPIDAVVSMGKKRGRPPKNVHSTTPLVPKTLISPSLQSANTFPKRRGRPPKKAASTLPPDVVQQPIQVKRGRGRPPRNPLAAPSTVIKSPSESTVTENRSAINNRLRNKSAIVSNEDSATEDASLPSASDSDSNPPVQIAKKRGRPKGSVNQNPSKKTIRAIIKKLINKSAVNQAKRRGRPPKNARIEEEFEELDLDQLDEINPIGPILKQFAESKKLKEKNEVEEASNVVIGHRTRIPAGMVMCKWPGCSRLFPSLTDLSYHHFNHAKTIGLYVCIACNLAYDCLDSYRKHTEAFRFRWHTVINIEAKTQQVTTEEGKTQYKCLFPKCGHRVDKELDLKEHYVDHAQSLGIYVCTNCRAKFDDYEELEEHEDECCQVKAKDEKENIDLVNENEKKVEELPIITSKTMTPFGEIVADPVVDVNGNQEKPNLAEDAPTDVPQPPPSQSGDTN